MGDRVAVLSRGILQQVDTPQNLYDHPRNLFVATFIGSPQMNTIKAVFHQGDEGAWLEIGDQRLSVPASLMAARPGLAAYDGRAVAVGIRPEHLEDAALEPGLIDRLVGTVDVREGLGSEVLLHVRINASAVLADGSSESELGAGHAIVARVSPVTALRPDDKATLSVRTEEMHLFDLETGLAIVGGALD